MLNELVERERHEKIAMWEMSIRAMGTFLGHSGDAVNRVVADLRGPLTESVFQTRYDLRALRQKLYQKLRTFRTRGRYMDILENMTVE